MNIYTYWKSRIYKSIKTELGKLIGLFFLLSFSSFTALADDKLCFHSGGPWTSTSNVPTVDGVVGSDDGWLKANQYVFGNGSTSPHAIVQMKAAGSAVYMSFEIANDPTFNDNDVIIITYAPSDTSPSQHRRIHIYPVNQGTGNVLNAPGGAPRDIDYWANSGTWNSSAAQVTPTWLQNASNNIRVTSSSSAIASKSYNVEIKIPISSNANNGINIPVTGDFGLYFNILRVDSSGGGDAVLGELKWPSTVSDIGTMFGTAEIEVNTPPPTEWGDGTLVPPCAGVKITNVYTNYPTNPNIIDANGTDVRLSVDIENSGSANADKIWATVKSIRFGLGGTSAFGLVPAPGNPMGPTGIIVPGGSTTLTTDPWNVSTDPNRATYLSFPNICSEVELKSTAVGTTLIANKFIHWNLSMGTASRFQQTATISTKGLGKPRKGKTNYEIDLQVFTKKHEISKPRVGYFRDNKFYPTRLTTSARPATLATSVYSENIAMQPLFQRNYSLNLNEVTKRYFSTMLRDQSIKKVISYYTKQVHGYMLTDKRIKIKNTTYPVRDQINSYEYLVGHNGRALAWEYSMMNTGVLSTAARSTFSSVGRTAVPLQKTNNKNNVYRVSAPKDSYVGISTLIEAKEGGGTRKKCFDK